MIQLLAQLASLRTHTHTHSSTPPHHSHIPLDTHTHTICVQGYIVINDKPGSLTSLLLWHRKKKKVVKISKMALTSCSNVLSLMGWFPNEVIMLTILYFILQSKVITVSIMKLFFKLK